MNKQTRTPLGKLKLRGYGVYDDSDNQIMKHDWQEIAAQLVHEHNAHDELVEALSQLIDRLDYHGDIDMVRDEGPIEDARAALAKAEKDG